MQFNNCSFKNYGKGDNTFLKQFQQLFNLYDHSHLQSFCKLWFKVFQELQIQWIIAGL